MSCSSCGCATLPCGCCEGVQAITPRTIFNRPGLPALSYRVGTHNGFLETMLARLSTIAVDGPGPDGRMLTNLRPLQGLTTRDGSDPAIALLDAWATVGDVLAFYQERIANEAFLRTATERRSVVELARLVGYTPRPGVAATTYLAYTLDSNQVDPVTIPAGTRTQSVPGPGETAQTFETGEDLPARREWNDLQVRLSRPQNITLDNVLSIAALQVAGTATNLKPGDPLLFVFAADGSASALRVVDGVDTQFADQTSAIRLRPLDPVLLACTALLLDFVTRATRLLPDASGSVQYTLDAADRLLGDVYIGTRTDPDSWADRLEQDGGSPPAALSAAIEALGAAIDALKPPARAHVAVTDPARFAASLLRPAVVQARNSLQLTRNLAQAFLPAGVQSTNKVAVNATGLLALSRQVVPALVSLRAPVYSDVATQLLVSFAPSLRKSYYVAWAGATLNPAQSTLQGVHALRARASLMGATASKLPSYSTGSGAASLSLPAGVLLPPNKWGDWTYGDSGDETGVNAFLDQANENLAPGGYVLAELGGIRQVRRIAQATTHPRTAYGLSGQTTELVFETRGEDDPGWRTITSTIDIGQLRQTKLYVQSDPLALVDERIADPVGALDENDAVGARQITLDSLVDGLTSGRWVILEGERDDIAAVDGVRFAELQMVSGVSQSYDAQLPGDSVHTTLILATDLAYRYKRATLNIYGNVAKATHGETRNETLGDGDGAQAFQSFTLKQPPLTFVAAPTAAGAQSTLQVRVNGVEWHESDSLAWLAPRDRGFVTLTADDGSTSVTFGDGAQGARLPSGVQNVRAVYRNGIGQPGNVGAGQIKLLQSRPLGVKEVINPLAASGGADKESRDLARASAPLSVMALDRLVSVADYTAFTRRFAGIAKALALRVSDGRQQLVYITIAGVDDIPIAATSDLYQNLLAALRAAGDPDLPLRVDLRELKALMLSANIKLLPDFEWESVVAAVRAQVLDAFGFDRRALGQPALLCEVVAAIQGVLGVDYVDVDAFGAVSQAASAPQRRAASDTPVSLLTQDDVVAEVSRIVRPPPVWRGRHREREPRDVTAWPGGSDAGVLRPAELAVFMPAVPDTLVLNQIP
jgi:hypothetical protein